MKGFKNISTISWVKGKVRLIDQSKLPAETSYIYCEDVDCLVEAIKTMKIRGAPALGIAAALGIVLGIQNINGKKIKDFKETLDKSCRKILNSRPTAVNISWAVKRMKKIVSENKNEGVQYFKKILLKEALNILQEDKELNRIIGDYGSKLIKDKDAIMTYCNAGALATADYGTALGVIYSAKEKGRKFKVFACETRPKLQGSRLTTWELMKHKIDVTLICDNMAATVMKKKMVNKIIVGADRIAANGDTANKIGTYNLALLAKIHKIPFYVAAPVSTVDISLKNGKDVPIEERASDEIIKGFGRLTAPRGIKVYNPAFDVTPAKYIKAIITERGIIRPPYRLKLKRLTKNQSQ